MRREISSVTSAEDKDPAGGELPARQSGKTYLLIHGAFHGGWCWKDVAARLRAMGHTVYAPTMTGHGERSHLMSVRPTVETYVEDMMQVIRYEDLVDVILVGHSFGGSIVSILADRMPERLRHLVYLDAMLLEPGQCPADISPPGHIDRYVERAVDLGHGLVIPSADPVYLGITDAAQQQWLLDKLTPQPLRTFQARLELKHELGNGIPATYIACSNPLFGTTVRSRDLAQRMPGWTYLEIPTGHDAMLLMPEELARMLDTTG